MRVSRRMGFNGVYAFEIVFCNDDSANFAGVFLLLCVCRQASFSCPRG
ncbi:hypothetical protein SPRA44_260103 [Serratia proteamaculans]|nr:hypothetical protein SPRA44_260103 [Serratia proteamaculans]